MNITTIEAINIVKEWGVDCDNFVAHNYKNYMHGGDPYDNSQECADYFHECLRAVTNLGIKIFDLIYPADESQDEK